MCGTWYAGEDTSRQDLCPDCFDHNFAGAHPPTDVWRLPHAAQALEDYVLALNNSQIARTPHQVAAMQELAETWRRQAEGTL